MLGLKKRLALSGFPSKMQACSCRYPFHLGLYEHWSAGLQRRWNPLKPCLTQCLHAPAAFLSSNVYFSLPLPLLVKLLRVRPVLNEYLLSSSRSAPEGAETPRAFSVARAISGGAGAFFLLRSLSAPLMRSTTTLRLSLVWTKSASGYAVLIFRSTSLNWSPHANCAATLRLRRIRGVGQGSSPVGRRPRGLFGLSRRV